jgi:hypothetical protein
MSAVSGVADQKSCPGREVYRDDETFSEIVGIIVTRDFQSCNAYRK